MMKIWTFGRLVALAFLIISSLLVIEYREFGLSAFFAFLGVSFMFATVNSMESGRKEKEGD